jgi:hypothetical protein
VWMCVDVNVFVLPPVPVLFLLSVARVLCSRKHYSNNQTNYHWGGCDVCVCVCVCSLCVCVCRVIPVSVAWCCSCSSSCLCGYTHQHESFIPLSVPTCVCVCPEITRLVYPSALSLCVIIPVENHKNLVEPELRRKKKSCLRSDVI